MLSLFEKHEGGFRRFLVLLVLVIFLSLNSFARTFYVSSTDGNDSYSITQAQNQSTPWRSLSLVNSIFSSLLPGDNVFFKRGDVFYGNLVANVSGNSAAKITIGAYGSGAKPLFSGFTFAQNWTSLGNGIWQCTLSATNANSNMVVVNDQVQAMGRYPNADAANGGYLNYESFNGYTSFTDNELSASPNWAGADVVMRKTRWIIDICKVGWHSGNSIGYTNPVTVNTYPGKTNFGYFIQNDPRTLDKFGEWYLNRQTKVFQMYFGSLIPTNYTVKVSAVDNIINLSSTRYITVDNIATEGSSMYGIYTKDGNSITIQNCDVRLSSNYGIHVWNSANVIVDNNTVTDVYNNGIYAQNQSASGTTITNNTLKNIGIHAGMGQSGDKTNIGIFVNGYNTLVQYNNIDGTGYTGLDFAGTNPVIRNNFVTNFCSVKDDGGGIYTQLNKAQTYANTIISGNIVLNAIGAKNGGDLSDQNILTNGIYLDEISGTFEVSNNSVANCGGGGLFYNNIVNVNTTGNTIFNNYKALALQRFTGGGPLLRNNRFTNNVLFPLYDNQYNFHYWNGELYVPTVTDIQSDMRQLGVFDNNYYRNDVVDPFKYFYHTYAGGQFFDPPSSNFDQWKPYMNQDYNSKISATIPKYKINNVVSANKVSAGTFDANISNVNFWSVNNNFSATWDNTNKISGGSIKVTPYSLENQSTLIYSPCGSVTAGKSYILKFSTYGTTVYGNVKASLRQSNAPYATFTSPQSKFFGIGFQEHEFLITPNVSEANTSYLIELLQASGTTYIDNVQFYEVTSSPVNVETQVRFEYNNTKSNKTVSLDGTYNGVDGTVYYSSITLAPYTSKVLLRDPNNTTPPTPPSSTLTVSGSANAVNCFGGSTTATISASGGTSPYSGTGSSVVSSGKNSLRLSFNSATGNYTFLYSAIGAVSAAKSYVLRFSTLGTSASGTLRASLRQTGSPYATLTNTQSGSFGTTKKDHQFIFNAPTSDVNASFLIEVAENSGITYLDNIAVFETNAAGELIGSNLYPAGDFENGISTLYSWSQNNNHTTALDISSKINATVYFAVTDAAGTVRSTGIAIDQPAGPLQAASTAPAIVVTGGTTTVTVSASGGTAPYSGVGNYTVGAGTYSYTVTDARGCTTTTAITVNQPSGGSGGGGALPSVSVTGNDVSCFGNSTTATVSASGGTAPYSGTGSFFVNSGIGSLKLSFKNTGTGNYTFNYWTIGSVSSTKSYSLRFSTLGSTNSGAFRVSLRQTGSPYSTISTVQTGVFGTNKTDHQFIFNNPVTTGDASFVIEIAENSGTTNLDNIAFFEATSTGDLVSQNLYPDGNFESNISRIYTWSANSNHVAEWDNNSKINATNYFTVTDASGAKRSVGFITNQPSSPLQAVATAPLITTAGGYTNVTLTATGGTPPYSDLGTLPVQAGFYEYRVTDSKGCSVIASITVAPYASTNLITSAIETSPIYCFSTNTAIAVTANGGNAPYTGTGSFVTTAGRNSLRLSCNNPVANQFIYNYYSIGAVSSAKRYALHFSTLGSTGNGVIQACLRQTSSPYSEITATETKSFGTTRVDHVFYFNNPVSTSDASFLIKLPQNSATTYIDNIAFFEVNAAGELISRNLYPEGDFEAGLSRIYMWTANSNHIAVVDNNNIINGTKYFTVTDALGAISTKGIIIRQPGMLLQAYASAPAITTPGGYTTINVTAAGGTPPYIGTGPSLPVQQGFHEFKVTDANGCSSVVGITTYTTAARTATTGSTSLSLTATSPLALEASTYPNPSTTAFNLRLNGGTTENVSITVMSFDGKVLYKTTGASNRTYNFGNHFVPGVYTVFIKQGSITKSSKVIKGQTR